MTIMKKKKVILSYDYELFFGDRSGTVQKSLIGPTNQLLDAMDGAGLRGNFFVDWQMLKYLRLEKDKKAQNDYATIVDQLQDIVRRGHRIELHIHPHWVDAKYNGDGTWNFDDFTHYSLCSFTKEEITQMFTEGTELLTSIARKVDPYYKIVAFRAGGWAVQPFELLKDGFEKNEIRIEASVAVGVYGKNLHSVYDFREAPDKDVYHFEDDVCKEVVGGRYIEVPITCYQRTFINKVFDKLTNIFTNKLAFITDGTHSRKEDRELCVSKSKNTGNDRGMIGFRMCPINIVLYLFRLNREIVCFLHHPKDQAPTSASCIRMIGRVAHSLLYSELK